VSEQTAKLLVQTGHGNWVCKRKDLVEAKGKGVMQTYWISKGATSVATRSDRKGAVGSSSSHTSTEDMTDAADEKARHMSVRMHSAIKETYGQFLDI
jgi:hypothetical protein